MSFSRLSLGTKLGAAFAIILFFMLAVTYMGINRMALVADNMRDIVEVHNKAVAAANEIIDRSNSLQIAIRNLIITKDETVNQKQKTIIDESRTETAKYFEELSKYTESAEGKQVLSKAREAMALSRNANEKVIALGIENRNEEAVKLLFEEAGPIGEKLTVALEQLIDFENKTTEQTAKSADKEYNFSRLFMICAISFALLAAILIAFFLTRSITKAIGQVTEGLSGGADQVAAASSQVAASAQNLAEGTSEQAAGIEETSASLEEISSMTHQNAQAANDANQIMHDTSNVVARASESMTLLTSSMAEISHASEETQKIVKTIDEISFQTNLLALNAAVEAARAGEAGAGFAVVADEVRNLAMRAAEAAKNTANLIDGTVKKIKEGSEVVEKTTSEFSKVVTSTGKMGELIGEIAAASQEQTLGIEQISKGIAEMDKVVQRNAASAEESASAAEEMNAQADQMKLYVKELKAVVKGRTNGSMGTAIQGGTKPERPGKAQKAVSVGPSRKLPAAKGTKTREASPEKVIPFDENEYNNF